MIDPHTPELMPKDDVATKSYPPTAFPKRSWPYVGAVEVPVPPLLIESVPVVSLMEIPNDEVAKSVQVEPFHPRRSPKFSVIAATSFRSSMELSVRLSAVRAVCWVSQ